ncbi:MAG: tRNA lysidine(34) synthetase TilS [Desulfuromonas sp.]|nr:MAG: tRNA lysidine(34) synthetase TilS [Desulfuromonas sp.]
MLEAFAKILRDNRFVSPGEKILAAVSGGADSMALLDLLRRLAPEYGFELVVAHLDHGLRDESHADAEFVAAYCRQHGLPLTVEAVDVAALAADRGDGIENTARTVRREFLQRVASEQGCARVALAHHADDQAETLLFRLLRGSGLSGLAAMRLQKGIFLRPLLPFRRSELERYLKGRGLDWREDDSNRDLRFSRNRIRNRLLPELLEYNPKVVEALNRTSRQAAAEEDFWDGYCAELIGRSGRQIDNRYELDIEPLLEQHPAARRRVLRCFLGQLQGYLLAIEEKHITQVEELITGDRPQADLDLPGIWVARRYQRLLCAKAAPDFEQFALLIEREGEYELPTGQSLQVELATQWRDDDSGDEVVQFDSGQVRLPLIVRSPRPGDRFRPSGMSGTKSLKNYFVDAKIDRESRQRTAVVCAGDEIVWLAGKRRCDMYHPVPGEGALKLRVINLELSTE